MNVIKRNGKKEEFNCNKIKEALNKAFISVDEKLPEDKCQLIIDNIVNSINKEDIQIEDIQDKVEKSLFRLGYFNALKSYILYRNKHTEIREFAKRKQEFINKYVKSKNTANATIDDNSNVANKNIAVLNSELYKSNNIDVNRYRVMTKLQELYPDFDSKQYVRDLEKHIIYKNDENSTFGFPYCVSITMYPFILNGIRDLGGLSAAPKNLDSFCGMFINLIFAVSSQFAGACATPEALLFFDFYARKEWGDNYMQELDNLARCSANNHKTIREQLHQYFQQIVYSLNQPAAARGYQSVFWNVSYFDKYFFDGVFENFVFPDGTKPNWESLNALQKEFMMWFNEERLKTIITFPVESFALIYKDGKFLDEENAKFVAEEYARGHSFFVYISDSADSLSSCCFDGDTRIMYSKVGASTFEKCEKISEVYDKCKDNVIEVLSYNPYNNIRKWAKAKLIKTKATDLYKLTFNNRAKQTEIIATHDHIFPILKNGNYVDVKTCGLEIGDKLLFDKAQWELDDKDYSEIIEVEIKNIERFYKEQDVFCLEMEDIESPYFVLSNGLITHNCRLKNKIQTREFSFTNGNIGVN